MGRKPQGEDPADKAARLRERRMTDVERAKSTEESAAGLSADIRSIYGQKMGNKPSSPYTPQKAPGAGVMNLQKFLNRMVGIKK
jgi:hypothetical protein